MNVRSILLAAFFAPIAWVTWSVLLLALFAACHLLGWREDTAVFSGTLVDDSNAMSMQVVHGLLYATSFLAASILSPILLIAAAIQALLAKRFS